MLYTLATQSVGPTPAAPGSLLEMQTLGPKSKPSESETPSNKMLSEVCPPEDPDHSPPDSLAP